MKKNRSTLLVLTVNCWSSHFNMWYIVGEFKMKKLFFALGVIFLIIGITFAVIAIPKLLELNRIFMEMNK
jgi:hypothetical protein